MATMTVCSNGVGLTVQVGRQGPAGPPGPLPPNSLVIDIPGDGAGAILLGSTQALPPGVVGSQVVNGYVTAQDLVSGDMVVWQLVAAIKLDSTGMLGFPGNPSDGSQASNPSVTLLIGDASMLACTITPTLAGNCLEIIGAGLAGRSIQWTGSLTVGGNDV